MTLRIAARVGPGRGHDLEQKQHIRAPEQHRLGPLSKSGARSGATISRPPQRQSRPSQSEPCSLLRRSGLSFPRRERSSATSAIARNEPLASRPDLAGLKSRQHAAWSSGDYSVVGTTLQIVGEELCEALDVRAGQKVLDVAAGNGNVSLAAARRWCDVVATDYVPALLDARASAPMPNGSTSSSARPMRKRCRLRTTAFDIVVSTFGVMFTPDQDQAAAEMLRVCRPGGKIGLANWTPAGFIGKLFKIIGKYMPPPAGVEVAGPVGHAGAHRGAVRAAAPRSSPSRATSCSVIARRSTCSTCSGPTTARC